ncbi:MAG: MFS transporter [Verrucomicrobiales bacterium]
MNPTINPIESGPKRSASWKWYLCGLLLLATTINYMDRQTLANAATRVTTEFQLSQEQYGDLELAFGWAFAAGSLIFGFLADRFRVYWLYPIVLTGWSLMGIASAHTDGYWPLLTCRILLGFFEAGHWPCALKTTFALLEPKDRTMGNSVLQSGASIGAIVTPPLMIWLMTDDISSWRFAFQVIGAIGLLWVVLWFLSIRKTELDVPMPAATTTNESTWSLEATSRCGSLFPHFLQCPPPLAAEGMAAHGCHSRGRGRGARPFSLLLQLCPGTLHPPRRETHRTTQHLGLGRVLTDAQIFRPPRR